MSKEVFSCLTSKIVTATIITLLLLMMVPTQYIQASGTVGKIVVVDGEDANQLASLIAKYDNVTIVYGLDAVDSADVVIVSSDTTNMDKAIRTLKRGGLFATVNNPEIGGLVSIPSLSVNKTSVLLTINATSGSLISSEVLEGPSTETVVPKRFLTLYDDEMSSFSYYALAVNSTQQCENVTENLAHNIASSLSESESVQSQSASDDWIKKFDHSGLYIINDAGDQLKTRYEVRQLNYIDEATTPPTEYWRTDPYIDHLLSSYSSDTGHCGPYMHERQVLVDAHSAEVYDYDPATTPQGSGASVGISFTVTTGGVGIGISYGWSWDNPGVRYDTAADYANSDLKWVETFNGPDYSLWPFYYSRPTATAYNSYNAKPSVVMRTPAGSGFDIFELKSTWQIYDDYMTFVPPFFWHLHRVIYTYWMWGTPDFAPCVPSTPSGPTYGGVRCSYAYSTQTWDPNGGQVYYLFDWGDGASTTTSWHNSGKTTSAAHSWSSSGTYYVRAWAKDPDGLWSGWSSSLEVRIGGVGGIVIPVNQFSLLAPYIGLASTILVATAITAIYVKHVKRRKEKQ